MCAKRFFRMSAALTVGLTLCGFAAPRSPFQLAALGDAGKPLWIGYRLPQNPDLNSVAREIEAKARARRNIENAACGRGREADLVACRREAEKTYRSSLLTYRRIKFGLYVGDPGDVRWLIDLSPESAIDSGLDQKFVQTSSGRVAPLGVHAELQPCRFAKNGSNEPISFNDRELVEWTCKIMDSLDPWAATNVTGHLVNATMDARARLRFDNNEIRFLLEHGADPTLALIGYVGDFNHDDLALVRLFLSHGANVNSNDGEHFHGTPLEIARNPDVIRLLLENGANVNRRNSLGETPLTSAGCNRAKVELLIAHHADVNAKDNSGETALASVLRRASRLRDSSPAKECLGVAELLRRHGARR